VTSTEYFPVCGGSCPRRPYAAAAAAVRGVRPRAAAALGVRPWRLPEACGVLAASSVLVDELMALETGDRVTSGRGRVASGVGGFSR
jgi:hypothetical protein